MAKLALLVLLLCVTGCATVPLTDKQYELTESVSPRLVIETLGFIASATAQSLCASNNAYDPSCYQDYSNGNQVGEVVNEWEGLEERALKICKGYTVVDKVSSSYLIATKRKLIIKCPVE
jgi:hypothetical protein